MKARLMNKQCVCRRQQYSLQCKVTQALNRLRYWCYEQWELRNAFCKDKLSKAFCSVLAVFEVSANMKFVSVINQLDAQNLFYSIISCLYILRAHVLKIALHSLWYNHSCRCDDTGGCVMQFWPPDDEHMCLKHVEAWNKTYCKTNFVHQVG